MKLKEFLEKYNDKYYEDFDIVLNLQDTETFGWSTYDIEVTDIGYSSKIIQLGIKEDLE
jgi:succinate dehydrogenase flavin-adding protein (antitoxin of CptAB toxin-antitoxin module)